MHESPTSLLTPPPFARRLAGTCKPSSPTTLIVLDDAQWLARNAMLRALLQARALSGGASVAFVLISQQAWGSGEFEDLPCMPTIHFANYTNEQMVAALVQVSKSNAGCHIKEGRRTGT
jgi:hypothetical protein